MVPRCTITHGRTAFGPSPVATENRSSHVESGVEPLLFRLLPSCSPSLLQNASV